MPAFDEGYGVAGLVVLAGRMLVPLSLRQKSFHVTYSGPTPGCRLLCITGPMFRALAEQAWCLWSAILTTPPQRRMSEA